MKKALRYFLSFVLCILFLVVVFFYPILSPYVGLKPMPEMQRPDQSEAETKDTLYLKALSKIEEILFQSAQQLQVPALSAAIGVDNQLIWANAAGYADIAEQRKADRYTQFRIGSVSKSVTAMGIGKLLESGQLSLDRSIQSYVPYFDQSKPNISIQQLASHTSGIRNYGFCCCIPAHEGLNNDQYESVAQSVGVFSHDKLLFEPGTGFSYATYNYTLISAAMEEVTGVSFLDYMAKTVFQPLEMNSTMGDLALETIANRATFYDVKKGKYKKAYRINSSNKWAGGGMLSTPSDLIKMANALLNDNFLAAATKAQLWQPVPLTNGEMNPQNYAIAWRIDATPNILKDGKVKIIHHGGTITGSIALLILFPEYNMSIAMMANRSGSSGELFGPIYEMAKVLIPHHPIRKREDS